METLLKKVDRLLRRRFPEAAVELHPSETRPFIGGVVVWDGFAKLDDAERGRHVRGYLRSELSPEEFRRVSLIAPMSVVEMGLRRRALERDEAEVKRTKAKRGRKNVS